MSMAWKPWLGMMQLAGIVTPEACTVQSCDIIAEAVVTEVAIQLSPLTAARLIAGSAAARQGGADVGDRVPDFVIAPGQRAVVVGSGYVAEEPNDPAPADGAVIVRLASAIGSGGLKNGGEPLTLLRPADDPEAAAIVASYGAPIPVEGTTSAGQSVVAVGLSGVSGGCDRPSAWRLHPLGSSTPGAAP